MFIFQEYGFQPGRPKTRQEDSTWHHEHSVARPVEHALKNIEETLNNKRLKPGEKIETLVSIANTRGVTYAYGRPYIDMYTSDFDGHVKKAYRYDLAVKGWQDSGSAFAQGVATQLGYQNDFGKFEFTNISDETFRLLAMLPADKIGPALLGEEGQRTMIRSKASCEDKIQFLFRLREETQKPETKALQQSPKPEVAAIDQLIMGQLEYIKNNYGEDALIRGMNKWDYIQLMKKKMM